LTTGGLGPLDTAPTIIRIKPMRRRGTPMIAPIILAVKRRPRMSKTIPPMSVPEFNPITVSM
jgi:hypothetical protein